MARQLSIPGKPGKLAEHSAVGRQTRASVHGKGCDYRKIFIGHRVLAGNCLQEDRIGQRNRTERQYPAQIGQTTGKNITRFACICFGPVPAILFQAVRSSRVAKSCLVRAP